MPGMDGDRQPMAPLWIAGLFLVPSALSAGGLSEIQERGFFTWGADEEGGGPFVYTDPGDPARRLGFEVDLASALARELSQSFSRPIEARFAQGQWDKLPDLLRTGRIDIVLNGYEWTPERAEVMASTLPYYVYELVLLVRDGDDSITSWSSLRSSKRRKVGVLGGSAAERYLGESFPEVALVLYDGNTNAMGDATKGRIDATVQDLPIALFYRNEFPGLRQVDKPAAPGRYVMFVRKEDAALRDALNRAILSLREHGSLRSIYESHGIWTKAQRDIMLLSLPTADVVSAQGKVDSLVFLSRHAGTLLESAWMTVQLSVVAFPLAILLGILIALARLHGPRWVSVLLAAYVEVLRGTPLMLQLFVLFYVLPGAGVKLDAFVAAILGLAINYSAYEAEIYRAGLQAVPAGQMEAALALGMSRWLALRRVVVPQAVRIVLPAVTNDFIALFKDTSVCSVITVVELTKRYNILAMTSPSEVLPLAAIAGLLYLCMSYPLSVFSAAMERRLRA